jgi:AAA+ superfamily predicted ATPase
MQMICQANDPSSKVSPPNLIIHGEPGVGKTEVIKYMCQKAGVSFICIPPGSLEQHIVNGTHIVFLNTLLRVAKESAGPVCLILNDGEELVAERQASTVSNNRPLLDWEKQEEDFTKVIKERRNALVNTILDLAGMQSNKVFFAVTTNRPEKIDTAFKTRASSFEIHAPGFEERKNIIISHLPRIFEGDKSLLGFFNHGRLEKMATSTEGFTGRNLVKTLELLSSLVTRNNKNIRQDLIDAAILQTRPSANANRVDITQTGG